MVLLLMALLGVLAAPEVTGSNVPCYRGDPCWPTASEVDALRQNLWPGATRLLKQTFGQFDPKIAPASQPLPHLSDEENAQPLYGLGLTQMEPLYQRSNLSSTCRERALYTSDFCKAQVRNAWLNEDPDFVVFPLNPWHVKKAIKFAKRHRLHIAVAGTGHEFNGRNQNDKPGGSILIRTILMRNKYADVNDSQGLGHPSLTFGAGIIFNEAQHFAMENGGMISTGLCDSVGIIGWSIGGGIGPYNPRLGYGADNLLAVDIVLASGKHVRAKATGRYADLFKALRGGGGSTWGIITCVTVKLHPVPDDGVVTYLATLGIGTFDGTTIAEHAQYVRDVTETWLPHFLETDANVASVVSYVIPSENSWYLSVIRSVYGGPGSAAAQLCLEHFNVSGVLSADIFPYEFGHPWELMNSGYIWSFTDPLRQQTLTSGFIQQGDTALIPDMMERLAKSCNGTQPCYMGFQTGLTGKPGSPQPAGTSLSPAMRTAWGWGYSMKLEDQDYFRQTFGDGLYMSESSPEVTDPTEYGPAYWGTDNYNQLTAVKDKYDPHNVFGCRQCVTGTE